jgi:TrmH family RNA methyltransferase
MTNATHSSREPTITSASNPRLKGLLALRRRRTREETGQTLVEGYEEIGLALSAGVRPGTVYVCEELFSPAGRAGSQDIGHQTDLLARLRDDRVEVVHLSRSAFEKVSYREGPDGLLAVVDRIGVALDDLRVDGADHLTLLSQGVEKPGNLGAMLRTADAAGVDAVVAADPVTDWGNPNVVRSSKGTVFSVPVAAATTQEVLAWLRRNGIRLVATTPDTETAHTAVDYRGAVAIAVGTEKEGLTDLALGAADARVRIPMVGRVNSLNAATAAAVVVYEAVRQRSG